MTPVARHELNGYRWMIEVSAAGRPERVASEGFCGEMALPRYRLRGLKFDHFRFRNSAASWLGFIETAAE